LKKSIFVFALILSGIISADSFCSAFVITKHNSSLIDPAGIVTVNFASLIKNDNGNEIKILTEYKGKNSVASFTEENARGSWSFDIEQDNQYNINLGYFTLPGKGKPIEIKVAIDDKPILDLGSCYLNRVYKNSVNNFELDKNGNQIAPRQIEVNSWYDRILVDPEDVSNTFLKIKLTKGIHKISIVSVDQNFLLSEINFIPVKELTTYKEYIGDKDVVDGKEQIILEGEKADLKSEPILRPLSDRTSPKTSPYNTSKIRMNFIGGSYWQNPGQWLEWDVNVPRTGFYSLQIRYQQSYINGFKVYRRLYIDGQIPFKEADAIGFPFTSDWDLFTLGGIDKPMNIYLQQGLHKLRLEVVGGEISNVIPTLDKTVYDLNIMYRKIIMVTSLQPDKYRDYNLETEIPGLIASLKKSSAFIKATKEQIIGLSRSNSTTAVFDTITRQLDNMCENPETIPMRINEFKNNISSLSAWILDLRNQPIDLDYIVLSQPGAPKVDASVSVFEQFSHEFLSFFYSFIEDYNSFGAETESNTVDLWIGTGRDQAQILRTMTNDMFTAETGINVNIKLVSASMVEAFLSGKSPDIAIMTGRGLPVNLAIRGALLDYTQFPDFDSIKKSFMPGAFIPYEISGGCYGIPDSQIFYMMFYRKDILDEINIKPPATWDEFFSAIPKIQRYNMDIGIPYTSIDSFGAVDAGMGVRNIFPALLFQNGGKMYKSNFKETDLATIESLDAFNLWTSFYKDYGLPVSYDFYSRFRVGEMPLAISTYNEYGRLVTGAPEIRGLWEMVPIPGTMKKDKKIDISQAGAGTASVILSNTNHKEEAWKFIKWWTGDAAQTRYAYDIEAQMGITARYMPSNINAFNAMPWNSKENANLAKQWQSVKEIPEIPGGYYLLRGLDNAFTETVYENGNPKEVLSIWDKQINEEILRKRKEFKLD
jgi:ABC-type glycerol-3-phosphate transport system substrate-binding protein